MNSFRYWRDPLCMMACALYAVNRWIIKPHSHSLFIRGHFNDLLLIPAALPLVLWLQRRMKLRTHDSFPSVMEMIFHFSVWSLICEVIGPRFVPGKVGDPLDVLAYAIGGFAAWLYWKRESVACVAAA